MEPMRPGFPPRFEAPGPPEFFNRMPFDEHHPRHRRHDDRRRFPREDGPPEMHIQEKPDRRSRWSNGSPRGDEVKQDDLKKNDNEKSENGGGKDIKEDIKTNVCEVEIREEKVEKIIESKSEESTEVVKADESA